MIIPRSVCCFCLRTACFTQLGWGVIIKPVYGAALRLHDHLFILFVLFLQIEQCVADYFTTIGADTGHTTPILTEAQLNDACA